MRVLRWLLVWGLAAASGVVAIENGPDPDPCFTYRPGRGLRLGSTGATVGGFTNVKIETTNETVEFAVDGVNVFLIYEVNSWLHAVGELQVKDVFTADEISSGSQNLAVDARRLFAEVALPSGPRIRAGTFLTPVGYWNLILAPPLTWTTEAPLVIEESLFQATTSGLMAKGAVPALGETLGYAIFTQFFAPLENDPELVPADYTAGLQLEYGSEANWKVGGTYELTKLGTRWSQLSGLHFFWRGERGEALCELLYEEGREGRTSQWGGYAQGVVDVGRRFHLVGRYEHFDPASDDPPVDLFTLGGVFKPFSFVVVKMEYRIVSDVASSTSEGFFSSFSTLF